MRSVKPGEALCASAIAQFQRHGKNFTMQAILEFDRLLKHSAIPIVPQQNGERGGFPHEAGSRGGDGVGNLSSSGPILSPDNPSRGPIGARIALLFNPSPDRPYFDNRTK